MTIGKFTDGDHWEVADGLTIGKSLRTVGKLLRRLLGNYWWFHYWEVTEVLTRGKDWEVTDGEYWEVTDRDHCQVSDG